MEFLSLVFLNIVLSLIFLSYSIYAFRNLSNRLILNFACMTLAMSIFSFGYTLELVAQSINLVFSLIIIQYFGLAFLSVFLFNIAYKFRYNEYPNIITIGYVSIIPFVSLVLVITNNMHNLYYKTIKLVPVENHFLVVSSKGLFYYLFSFNLCLSLVFSIYALFFAYKNNRYNLKKQSKIMLTGLAFPIVLSIPFLVKDSHITPVLLGFLFMTYFSYKALFKYHFLDLKETIRSLYIDKISEGIFVIDNENRMIDFNREASILLPFLNIKHTGNVINDYELGKKIIEIGDTDLFELQLEFKEGKKNYKFKKNPIFSKGKLIAYIYIVSDITENKTLISDLSYLANHDFLTGINNRLNFLRLANLEINNLRRYGGEFSLVMIDIDFFKKVNDTFGHNVGDEVLKGLVLLIKNNLRETDIFARVGGEEFCLILPKTTIKSGKNICEKIRDIVENTPIIVNDLSLKITVSLGMTYYNNEMTQVKIETIIDLADKALYNSKKLGRNKVIYSHFPLRY